MINNYFFQFQLPTEKDFKIRIKKNLGTVYIQKLKEREETTPKAQKRSITLNTKKQKPKQLTRYIELIQKRAKKSFVNSTYVFPRTSSSKSLTPRSVKSMKGVSIYKLNLQNKQFNISKSFSSSTNKDDGKLTSRLFLKQKIFPRKPLTKRSKHLVTQINTSRQKKNYSRISIFSLSSKGEKSNPLKNSLLNERSINNKSKLSNSSKISNKSMY